MLKLLERSTALPLKPHNRRLFGVVLRAFYQACDQDDPEVASPLLDVLTHLVSSSDTGHKVEGRRSEHDLIAARDQMARLARRVCGDAPSRQAGVRPDVLHTGTKPAVVSPTGSLAGAAHTTAESGAPVSSGFGAGRPPS